MIEITAEFQSPDSLPSSWLFGFDEIREKFQVLVAFDPDAAPSGIEPSGPIRCATGRRKSPSARSRERRLKMVRAAHALYRAFR